MYRIPIIITHHTGSQCISLSYVSICFISGLQPSFVIPMTPDEAFTGVFYAFFKG